MTVFLIALKTEGCLQFTDIPLLAGRGEGGLRMYFPCLLPSAWTTFYLSSGLGCHFPPPPLPTPSPPGLRSLPLPFHSVRRRLQQHLPSSLLLVSISVSTSRPRVPLSIASTKFTQLLLCASFHARLQVYQSDKTWSLPSRSFCSSGGSGDRGRRDCSRKRGERAWGGWRTTRGV